MKSSKHYRSNLKVVRGLGAAHDGTHHFWVERISALALVPLTVWFMINLVGQLVTADRVATATWFAQPMHAILMAIFAVLMFVHSRLGVQVIIEDYVHCEGKKLALLLLNKTLHLLLGAGTVFAILHLHFNGI